VEKAFQKNLTFSANKVEERNEKERKFCKKQQVGKGDYDKRKLQYERQ